MIADMAQLHPHPVTGDLFESPVLPGSGWPGDLATTRTLVAKSSAEVLELAQVETRDELDARISVCRACPRLVEWREEVALSKRASFAEQPYWGRPVPGWGAAQPKIVVLGLAPAANGANRTGRMFTAKGIAASVLCCRKTLVTSSARSSGSLGSLALSSQR